MAGDKLSIICKKCGKLKSEEAYEANREARVCDACFEPLTEITDDLIKHVQKLYDEKKTADLNDE